MTSRRDLLKGAAAASMLPLLVKLDAARARDGRRIPVVYDERFASSVAFGAEARSFGAEVYPTGGDITGLWYHTLHDRWQRDAAALAGLTTHGALFCLERLGWTYGLRLTHRAQHQECLDGTTTHACAGPQALSAGIESLQSAGTSWPQTLAHLLARDPRAASVPLPDIYVGPNETPRGDPLHSEAEPLFSWVLAPMKRK
jgi:hypothetical protein